MGSAIYAKMFKQKLKYDESKEQDNPDFFKQDEDYMADRKAVKDRKGKPIQLDVVNLGTIPSQRYTVPNTYKEGDHADEDDLETSTGKQESGQGFSTVRIDNKGNNYVIRAPKEN